VTGQSAVTHTYDVAGRLERINQGSAQVSFGYDAANRRTSLTLPNGIVVEYGYDDASRLTAITYKNGGTTLGNITYGYDFAGRRTKVGGSFARTSLPVGFNPASHDDANRLTQKEGSTLTYDESGNLTGDGVNTYSWDARNQLSGVSGGVTASFLYDAFGRRVGKTVNGLTTNYLYDGPNIVQELSGVSPLANILTGGTDEVFMRTDGQGTRSFLTDGLRSTLALADNSGNLLTQYTYDPFGGTTFSGAANDNTSQYTGRENDGTGLYYYRARYYSPSLHRFVSEDPIDFSAGDANLYAYVLNSPVNYTDPSGLSVWRTIFRVATQSAHPVANVRELTKRNAVAQVRAALDLAGEGAIIQAENDAARDAIARALSADGKLRRTDKYPENPYLDKSSGYPAGVHPNAGPYQHVHVQTAPPGRERLGMLFAPMSMTLSGRKDVTSAQFASAAAWDIISAVDPIFITDALEWYFGLSNE
jgi:RHS repeat-associated protein